MNINLRQILLLTVLVVFYSCVYGQEKTPEINVVYGDKHIFTIQTPTDWINDRKVAKEIGLVNFFYPLSDTLITQKNYVYANAYDKKSSEETLQSFIDADLKKYRTKYPGFQFEKIDVRFNGNVKNGQLYSLSNLRDRFKEEVLFAETTESIIVFSFSATTEESYKKYHPVFDSFVRSFIYRGNDPRPFLEYMSKKKNN
jgi:hypothetical protein